MNLVTESLLELQIEANTISCMSFVLIQCNYKSNLIRHESNTWTRRGGNKANILGSVLILKKLGQIDMGEGHTIQNDVN